MVGLIIFILLISILTLFWPSNITDPGPVSNNTFQNGVATGTNQHPEQEISMLKDTDSVEIDDRTERMTAAYEVLENKRKYLKKRLSRLKHDMWGLKFKPEVAKQINEIIINAVNLNKNPAMLGAFTSVEDIQNEVAKVDFAHKSLDQVNDLIQKQKDSKEG